MGHPHSRDIGYGEHRHDDHGHDDHGSHGGHGHGDAAGHGRVGLAGVVSRAMHGLRPHSHEPGDQVDAALEASAEGMRVLWASLGILAGTAVLQAVVAGVSGSVALLGDTLHNAADALTAVPLGVAFAVGRRPATRRYTYGFGRAEDLAGVAVVVLIAASSALAGWEAVTRLAHPRPVSALGAVAAAAATGFAGNELAARYRIRAGRRVGSAALVADGLHARADGFTSLAVLLGAGGDGHLVRLNDGGGGVDDDLALGPQPVPDPPQPHLPGPQHPRRAQQGLLGLSDQGRVDGVHQPPVHLPPGLPQHRRDRHRDPQAHPRLCDHHRAARA
jgi:hypothetical protein